MCSVWLVIRGGAGLKQVAKASYVRVHADLMDRVEDFRRSQEICPSMTETIRALLERGLIELEKERAARL